MSAHTDASQIEQGARLAPVEQFIAPDAIFDPRFGEDPYNLSPYDRLVYLYLCRRRSKKNVAFPSYNTIARDCGISRRTAIYAVQKLVAVGLLRKLRRKNGDRHSSNVYQLNDPKAILEVVHHVHHPGAPHAPPLVHQMHHPGAPDAPEGYTLKDAHIEGIIAGPNSSDRPSGTTKPPPPKAGNPKSNGDGPLTELVTAVKTALATGAPADRQALLTRVKRYAARLPETDPPRRKNAFPRSWQTVCQQALDLLRGVANTGTGYSEVGRYAKDAFRSGYTPLQWIECAERLFRLREQGANWLGRVAPALVNKYLPEYIAGRLDTMRPNPGVDDMGLLHFGEHERPIEIYERAIQERSRQWREQNRKGQQGVSNGGPA